jgi:gamma-glutamyltranspeptidase/glutathione hydrolase
MNRFIKVSKRMLFIGNFRPVKLQWAVLFCALSILPTACGDPEPQLGELGAVTGFLGVVAADEPRAALAAFDVLSAGGTASDAAAAAFFTMTVTYPVGAGLGGGGICIAYDAISDKAESIDFLPRPAANGGTMMVPGALRGMASLHARYGRLRWSQVVAPAERAARFGHPISRALKNRLEMSKAVLDGDLMLKQLFLTDAGEVKNEGTQIVQVQLASVLGRIRSKGVSDFHGGKSGKLFVEDAAKLGGSVSLDDLRKFIPTWKATRTWQMGNEIVHGPSEDTTGGVILAKMVDKYLTDGNFDATAQAAISASALAGERSKSSWGDAAVAVIDSAGNAVSCQFTTGVDMGTGRMLPSVGFVATPADSFFDRVAPMLAHNPNLDQGYFAGASSQGIAGIAALAPAAVRILNEGQTINQVIAAPSESAGRLQIVNCTKAPNRDPESCDAGTDPRGFGLALGQPR